MIKMRKSRTLPSSGRGVLAAMLGLLLAAGAASAATFENLYTVTVPVQTGAGDRRAQAVRDAMRKLLTRVTGRRDAAAPSELADLVANAESYLDSYGRPSREEALVGFSRGEIEAELTELGLPFWGAERPLTLVWLAVDRGSGERGLLSATGGEDGYGPEMTALLDELESALLDAADERGLPITLPLWDLVDINTISFAELWGGFDPQIAQASRRYGADAVLVGRMQLTEFGPRAQWTMLRNREPPRRYVSRDVASAVHWVADQFASEYASVGGTRNTRITVSAVGSLADYGRVISFLDGVSVLESVDVETYEDSVLTLSVAARGDASVLERVLTLGEVLAPVPRSFGDGASEGALAFEVVR